MRNAFKTLAVALALSAAHATAQQTVNIPDVVELSGAGAVSGTNWRDGVILAEDEVNAKGGILGRKIVTTHSDTQSNPGISRAQVQKALDGDPYVILGPIFSGSVKVCMVLAQARGRGHRTVDGLGMLLQQAGFGFRKWFGGDPKVTPELRALVEADIRAKTPK